MIPLIYLRKDDTMNSQQLEMFISVAKHLNFTKAATEFFTSQPTISRQISLLEEEWDFPLFVRNKKEVRLTPGGSIMLSKAKEILALIDSGIQESKKLEQGINGTLRIGCLETMNLSTFVLPTATYYNRQNPGINVEVERRSFAELRQKLESDMLDIIFTFHFEIKNMTNILYDKFCSVPVGILYSKNHALSGKKDLQLSDFKNETFILPSDSPGRKEELFDLLGFPCNINYVPNLESQILNVRSGKGVALIDTSTDAAFDEKHYGFYYLPKGATDVTIYYVWKRGNLNPALIHYINTLFLKEYIDVFNN